MNAQKTASRIYEEDRKLVELAAALEEQTAVLPRSRYRQWVDSVRAAFEHFRAHVILHQALEERDGYLVPIVDQQPVLAHEVERLAHEHGEIRRLMDGIQQELNELTPEDGLLIRDCCRRIQSLLQYVEHHEKDENLLVLSTFGRDLGTVD